MTAWLTQSAVAPGLSDTRDRNHKTRAEDVASTWRVRDGVVLAVADGVGSNERGAEAAALAVSLATAHTIATRFDVDVDLRRARDRLRTAFLEVRREFLEHVQAERDGAQWKTTLALVVVGTDNVVVAWVGDPILAMQAPGLPGDPDHGDKLVPVVFPERAGASDTATRTLHDTAEHVHCFGIPLPGVTGVLLSTDGLERFLAPRPAPPSASPYCDDIFTHVVQFTREQRSDHLHHLLHAPSVLGRKGDDIGVAVAAR